MLKTPRILSFLLIVLVLALTAFTVFSITSEARMALKQSSQDQLMDVAEAVATQIDGDSFETIRPKAGMRGSSTPVLVFVGRVC